MRDLRPGWTRPRPSGNRSCFSPSAKTDLFGKDRLGSALAVLVVAAPPDAGLVAPLGGAVEPLVGAPEAVQSARIGGIGVVDGAVLAHERAHARPVAHVGAGVGSASCRELADGPGSRRRVHRVAAAPVVVFD